MHYIAYIPAKDGEEHKLHYYPSEIALVEFVNENFQCGVFGIVDNNDDVTVRRYFGNNFVEIDRGEKIQLEASNVADLVSQAVKLTPDW